MEHHLFTSVFIGIAAGVTLTLVSNKYLKRINHFPGPFLYGFTDFWRAYRAWFRRHEEPMGDLHERYGDVVRMGPRVLYFSNPKAVRDIYVVGNFRKSDYYTMQAPISRGRIATTLFASTDPIWHDSLRRTVNGAFLPTSVGRYEHLIDKTIDVFLLEVGKRFADRGEPMDLFKWIRYFSFDVMGDIAWTRRHGFIEAGDDISGIIGFVESFLTFGVIAGNFPVLTRWTRQNPVLLWLERIGLWKGNTFPGAKFALNRLFERRAAYVASGGEPKGEGERQDLLDAFLRAQKKNPQCVDDTQVLGLSLSMIIAGSKTIGIALTVFFYHLLRNPRAYTKLLDEIDTLPPADTSSTFHTPYSVSKDLPYLHACVQEALRVHPPFSLTMERVTPPDAPSMIAGVEVPPNTVVGCNPWIIHRDQTTFSMERSGTDVDFEIPHDDVNYFIPERWLQSPEKARLMERNLFHFGSGKYMCLGKHIAHLEMYKFIPSFLRTFEIRKMNPDKDWSVFHGANINITDVDITLTRREGKGQVAN